MGKAYSELTLIRDFEFNSYDGGQSVRSQQPYGTRFLLDQNEGRNHFNNSAAFSQKSRRISDDEDDFEFSNAGRQ